MEVAIVIAVVATLWLLLGLGVALVIGRIARRADHEAARRSEKARQGSNDLM